MTEGLKMGMAAVILASRKLSKILVFMFPIGIHELIKVQLWAVSDN
jgi:hypothetical protein